MRRLARARLQRVCALHQASPTPRATLTTSWHLPHPLCPPYLQRRFHQACSKTPPSQPVEPCEETRVDCDAVGGGAKVRGLSAACAAGTAAGLSLGAQLFSPALGLMMLQCNGFVANLLCSELPTEPRRLGRLGPCFQLCRELYFQRDGADAPTPTRSRSKPAFYLTPARLGHLIGLAVSADRAPLADLEQTLKSMGSVSLPHALPLM
jgi:hypothetical protein